MEIKCHGLHCQMKFSKPDSEGWMRTSIVVMVPNFEGSFQCSIEVNEFEILVQKLRKFNETIGQGSEISWANMEGNVELNFNLDRLGHITGSYMFAPGADSMNTVLSGDFEADQSYIHDWLEQAEGVMLG
ncbi:hypothetical protein ACFL35_04640 [Candidatus Riflebacteria bacterium]